MITVEIKILKGGGGHIPEYQTGGAAGADLRLSGDGAVTINPGETAAAPTGIAVAIPEGYEGQVRARSGLALKHSIGIINAPGTIDRDYRGEVKVLLTNFGTKPYVIEPGERIAQLVIAPVARAEFAEVKELKGTERGEGGFGHTGI